MSLLVGTFGRLRRRPHPSASTQAVLRFAATRLALAIAALLIVSVAVFTLVSLLPGNILQSRLGTQALPQQYAALAHQLGIDRPAWQQYLRWLVGLPTGSWGDSWMRGDPVFGLVIGRLGNSLALGAVVIIILLPLSFGLGTATGLHPDGVLDRIVGVVGSGLLVIPEFVTGILLLLLFSVQLHWFPVSLSSPGDGPWDRLRLLVLPALPVVLSSFGYLTRLVRSSTIDVAQSAYVGTAVRKGLSRRRIVLRHIARNALPPNLSSALLHVGSILGGLVIVEQLFSYPGLGKLIVDATVQHDTPVLLAGVMVTGCLTVLAIIVADALLLVLDPRTRRAAA